MNYDLRLYTPHPAQKKFHESRARYRVASWGRQSGKSTACANELLKRAWEEPNTKYWFISPTHEQAKLQYRRTIGMLSPCWQVLKKKNQTELRIKLINDSEITFKSGEVGHNLRGATLNGCVIDEVREQPPDLWGQVVRPMLATTKGWAAFVSTPNGFDFFYDLQQRCTEDQTGTWSFLHAPSTANPLFTQEEFDQAKREMGEEEFAQEILAEFRSITRGSAYGSFSQLNCLEQSPHVKSNADTSSSLLGPASLLNPFLPIHLYCDWNVTHMGWVLNQFRHGSGHYAFDEIYLERSHTQEAADLLVHKLREYESQIGKLQSDPQIILVGDATGASQKTSASGKTDFMILEHAIKSAGYTMRNLTPASNPQVKDRVNTMNARFKAADGTSQLWLNPKTCPKLKRDCERVTWKPLATGAILDQSTDTSLTHLSDAWGYGICVVNPIDRVKDVGRLKVVRR